MENTLPLQIITILGFLSIFVVSLQTQVRPEEYLGCYTIDEEKRTFLSSPGDYNENDTSPLHCLWQCGKKFRYAALQEGKICLCGNTLPVSGKVDDSECNISCPGSESWPEEARSWLSCGGRLRNSIYSATERILGLSLDNIGRLPLLRPVIISGNMVNGLNVTFTFNLGDGSKSVNPSDQPQIRHIYDQPGTYIVSMEARNPATGSLTVSKMYEVDDPMGPIEFSCPPAAPLGKWLMCSGHLTRGSRINNTFYFGDGTQESMSLSSRYYSAGPMIPRDNTSFQGSMSHPVGTIVSPAYEFRHDGQVTEWEFEAVKTGNVKLQVLRPGCSSGEMYCLSSKSCLSQNETCGSTTKEKCKPSEIFCIFRRHCIANTTQSMKTCDPLTPYQTSEPRADYEVISESRFKIATIGHHIETLPAEDQVHVQKGDVLGWFSEGGELAYRLVTPADGATFEFEYTGSSDVGDTLLRSSNPNLHHRHYIMAAHYVHPVYFVTRHAYNSTGRKSITSNVTQPVLVAIDIPIGETLTFTYNPIVNTRVAVEFGVPWHVGSNVTYIWDFGDGNQVRTHSNTTTNTYSSSGEYNIILIVANSVNNRTLFGTIAVYDYITGFKFSKPIPAKAIGLATEIEWETEEGTNVTYVVDFGDSSDRFQKTTTLEASRKCVTTHTYAQVGNYTVTVYAFNRVGPNISISHQALVEIPVSDVDLVLPLPHLTEKVYVADGDNVTVYRIIRNGTNVKCLFDFGDGSPPTVSTESNTSHAYNQTGTYHINVTCYNAWNSVSKFLNATVVVQNLEAISGLRFDANPTIFTEDSQITISMTTGTTFFCTVDFADNETQNIDYSYLEEVIEHRYRAVGSYNASVNCWNRLGNETYRSIINVDIPMEEIEVNVEKKYIRVGEDISVDVNINKGSRIQYVWDFGDGNTYLAHSPAAYENHFETRTHAYSTTGQYRVTVTVSNSLSNVTKDLPSTVVVEFPIKNISLTSSSPVRLNPGEVTYEVTLLANVTPPTDAFCVWDFGDQSTPAAPELCPISPDHPFVKMHKFEQTGVFTTLVNISNNVSSVVLSVEVDVQELLEVVIIPQRMDDGVLALGFGPSVDHFQSQEPVYFNVTSQPKDLSYTWDFGDGSVPVETLTPFTVHVFDQPGNFSVKVTVANILATLNATKEVIVQKAVGNVSLNSSYPTYNGDPTYFSIEIEDPGTDVCLTLDLKDSHIVIFGEELCRPPSMPNQTFYHLSANQTSVNYTHTYGRMGPYAVTLTATNIVSDEVASTLVNITSNPCDFPTVKIVGVGLSQDRINKIQKSLMLGLNHEVKYHCPVAHRLIFIWSAFMVTLDDPDNETYPLVLPVDPVTEFDVPFDEDALVRANLIIRERKLPFGLIKFKLTLRFEAKDRDLSDVFGSASVLIEVERSNMLAVIKGSQRRSVGYELNLVLDASDSEDPDVPDDKSGVTFTWMCRKKNEDFPSPDSAPSDDGGCWGGGKYELLENEDKVEVYTGNLTQNAEYVFRVVVQKEGRQAVFDQSVLILSGQPPTMVIENVFNTLSKKNPFARLIMEGRCVDCEFDDLSMLEYKWSLYLLQEDVDKTLESSWEQVDDLAGSAATGLADSSLIIEPDYLLPGREYRLQLNAWKPGGYPGGFVIEQFVMNTAPQGGFCEVSVFEGFALETDFHVRCGDWNDEDQPFMYLIELKNGDDIVPLYAGFESATSAVFPLGKVDLNYTIEVRMRVMDTFLLSTYNYFSVRVLEPERVNYDKVLGDLNKTAGENGGDQKAVQLATAASSVLNAKSGKEGDDSEAEKERTAFRGELAEKLSEMPVEDFDAVAMQGEALNSLTQAAGEIDEDAQNSTVKALNEMGDFLSGSKSARDVENVAKSLGSAIGNVVNASIQSYKKAANGSSPGSDPGKSQNNTKNAIGVIDKVGGALQKQLAAGDKPKAISTPNLDLSVGRKTLEDIAGSDEDDDEEEGMGAVRVPNPKGLFGGSNASLEDGATSAIGSTISAMDDNPYAWDNSSSDLNSKTVGLSLTDGNGKPLDLAGQQLEMFVPRNLKLNPVKPMELNHFEEGDPPMRVHKFNRSSTEAAIVIEIKPFNPKIKFLVAVRYDKKPTARHYDFAHTFPSLEEAKKLKKRPHPFTYVVPHVLINPLLTNGQNGSANVTLSSLLANVTIKQFYLGVKAVNKDQLGNVNTSYALRIYLPSCKMFDEERNTWTTAGCKVGNKTIANITHCLCTPGEEEEVEEEESTTVGPTTDDVVTATTAPVKRVIMRKRFKRTVNKVSFASSMFVAPNPIDFDKVFNVNLSENPISLATVLSIFGVYLIIAIWARREDKKDVGRAGVTPLEDNDAFDRYHYEITVCTGYGKSAGTTADVYFILSGDGGESEPRLLKDPKRKTFQRRGVDVFLATFPESLGELNYLHIWHNNAGRSPSWYVSRVLVQDLNNDKKYLFICENWLAVEEGDGAVDKLIPVAGHEEMTSFNHLFYSTTQRNLADGHLWFSVFIRPARSRFTRLQRVTCCLTLLYCSMLTNAMFYQIGGESDPASTLQIGPLAFSPAQIGIGIISSLIVLPVNIFIVSVFRNVEVKPSREELKERRKRRCWWLQELFFCFFDFNKSNKNDFIAILHTGHQNEEQFLDFSSKTNLAESDEAAIAFGVESEEINFRISKQERREEMEKKLKKKKKKKLLPYWFLYVAWAVCFMTCFVTAFFVVLYGLQFGKEKSAQWISSMLVTFFQDVLISQPIKVLGIALVIAIIIKKPPEEDEEDDENKKKLEDEDWLHESPRDSEDKRMRPKSLIRLQPPDKSKLEKAREIRFKEMKMNAIIKEVSLYIFFVVCLCIVSYSHRDPTSFAYRQAMYNTFVDGVYGGKKTFSKIGNRENFYLYAKTTLMTALYSNSWYNGNYSELGFTPGKMAYVIGMARLRQVRVENQSCQVANDFESYIHKCNDWYSFFGEDIGQYDVGWLPLKNESLYDPPFTYEAWEYNSSDKLDTLPVMAFASTYSGGGFVADLGETEENALRVIQTLENNTWIDSRTRAVITEVAVYNAAANLFCLITLVVEFLPTNGVFLFTDLKVARLFTFGGGFETFLLVCEVFILLFFAVFFYQEFKQLYKKRKGYFKEFWNYIEFSVIMLVITCIGMFFTRLMLVENAVETLANNPGRYVSFSRVASWNEVFMYMVSFVVFMAWIKAIKLLRFNRRITMLAQTLKGSAGPLAAFSIVFLVFFFAYSLFAFAVFGKDLSDFFNFVSTCETVMGILLGAFDYLALEEVAPVLGPLFFFTFMVFGSFILMNMFLTIVMDVFAEVKDSVNELENEYEIVEFMIKRFRKFAGIHTNKIGDETEVEKKDMERELKEDMIAMKQKKMKARRKFKPMDLVAQRFTSLESSLSGFYCEEWAEERLLDHIVERRWGVNTVSAYAVVPDAELKDEQHIEELRKDMYAAADRYGAEDSGGMFNLSFEEENFTFA